MICSVWDITVPSSWDGTLTDCVHAAVVCHVILFIAKEEPAAREAELEGTQSDCS